MKKILLILKFLIILIGSIISGFY